MLKQYRFIALFVCIGFILSACGGGGGGSEGSANLTPAADAVESTPNDSPDPPAANATIMFSWDAPTEWENGDNLDISDIGGYEIAYRLEGEDLFITLVVDDAGTLEHIISNLESGSYEFKIATFDSENMYSNFSDILTITISSSS